MTVIQPMKEAVTKHSGKLLRLRSQGGLLCGWRGGETVYPQARGMFGKLRQQHPQVLSISANKCHPASLDHRSIEVTVHEVLCTVQGTEFCQGNLSSSYKILCQLISLEPKHSPRHVLET